MLRSLVGSEMCIRDRTTNIKGDLYICSSKREIKRERVSTGGFTECRSLMVEQLYRYSLNSFSVDIARQCGETLKDTNHPHALPKRVPVLGRSIGMHPLCDSLTIVHARSKYTEGREGEIWGNSRYSYVRILPACRQQGLTAAASQCCLLYTSPSPRDS